MERLFGWVARSPFLDQPPNPEAFKKIPFSTEGPDPKSFVLPIGLLILVFIH